MFTSQTLQRNTFEQLALMHVCSFFLSQKGTSSIASQSTDFIANTITPSHGNGRNATVACLDICHFQEMAFCLTFEQVTALFVVFLSFLSESKAVCVWTFFCASVRIDELFASLIYGHCVHFDSKASRLNG